MGRIMTDRERKVKQLQHLINTAHNDNYDFIYLPVGDAKLILKLLNEMTVISTTDKQELK